MPPRSGVAAAGLLPPSVKSALKQLPDTVQQLLGVHAKRRTPLSDSGLARLTDSVNLVNNYLADGEMRGQAAAAILACEGATAALVQLIAHVVREEVPTGEGRDLEEGVTLASVAYTLVGNLLLAEGAALTPSDTSLAMVSALLRGQALQAIARKIAAAAQVLQSSAEADAAGPGPSGGQAAARKAAAELRRRVRIASRLCSELFFGQSLARFSYVHRTAEVMVGPAAIAPGQAHASANSCQPLGSTVQRALHESCFMEHAGRLMLSLALPSGERPTGRLCDAMAKLLQVWSVTLHVMTGLVVLVDARVPSVIGPIARLATLEMGILALSLMDAQTTHGSAQGLLGGNVRQGALPLAESNPSYPCVEREVPFAILNALSTEVDCAKADRVIPRLGTAHILLRMLILADASLRVASDAVVHVNAEGAVVASTCTPGGKRHPFRALIEPEHAVIVAKVALDCMIRMLPVGPWPAGPWQPLNMHRCAFADAAWFAALSMVEHAVPLMDDAKLAAFSRTLAGMLQAAALNVAPVAPLEGPGGRAHMLYKLSPEPPLSVGIALEVGVLPALERLLRLACTNTSPAHTSLAALLLGEYLFLPRVLAFMVYAPPEQSQSFLATLVKLLRWSGLDHRPALRPLVAALQSSILCLVGGAVHLYYTAAKALTHPDDTPITPFTSFLENLLWLVPGLIMPELSRLARPPELRVGLKPSVTERPEDPHLLEDICRYGILAWVRVLATTYRDAAAGIGAGSGAGSGRGRGSQDGAPATHSSAGSSPGQGAAGAAAAGEPEEDPVNGLRAHLVQELAVVPLLDAALGLVWAQGHEEPLPRPWLALLSPLAEACCAVAAALPEEVRAACTADRGPQGRPGEAAEAGAGPGPARSSWRPEVLRLLARRLEVPELASTGLSPEVAALAAALEAGGELAGAGSIGGSAQAAMAAAEVPAALAWSRSHWVWACANTACVNVTGDRELGLKVQQCGRCGRVSYCCRECQLAHWRAGHKEACTRVEPSGAGA
ncbi:hypothetical protein HYH03_007221 [Edaphochlamys debaryana]|uniref:MYND-type domain-containing protein n=1 Tax=Edaphochlamys debaryana TaxID=47281 RepID=A0A835Y3V5_9CHLO|nr:hypothetical protein HYH03_007221 [Edaphochlamys debaryana]|eukprot:KAG2494707.1 hypothetical protein HYH03_007221 [Edaphochlamys debaryana]